MKRPCIAQCHKICLFLEHGVTFAMIYVKFNNHKRKISYSLWKGHGEMKISPWKKKTSADIFGLESHTHSNFPRSERTLIHMCGAKITAQCSCTEVFNPAPGDPLSWKVYFQPASAHLPAIFKQS